MALNTINPTTTSAWQKLQAHFEEINNKSIKELFEANAKRFEEFSIQYPSILIDYSKNRINAETIQLLIDLAKETKVDEAIQKYCKYKPWIDEANKIMDNPKKK